MAEESASEEVRGWSVASIERGRQSLCAEVEGIAHGMLRTAAVAAAMLAVAPAVAGALVAAGGAAVAAGGMTAAALETGTA